MVGVCVRTVLGFLRHAARAAGEADGRGGIVILRRRSGPSRAKSRDGRRAAFRQSDECECPRPCARDRWRVYERRCGRALLARPRSARPRRGRGTRDHRAAGQTPAPAPSTSRPAGKRPVSAGPSPPLPRSAINSFTDSSLCQQRRRRISQVAAQGEPLASGRAVGRCTAMDLLVWHLAFAVDVENRRIHSGPRLPDSCSCDFGSRLPCCERR